MDPQSIFEKFSEADVSRWVNIVALIGIIAGPAIGALVGLLKKPFQRYLILGCLFGLLGPAVALSWHVVDARTSYWDHLYRDKNPDQPPRLLWPILGAGKLDSVRNLASLAAGFIVAGIVIGLGIGFFLNWLDRRFPAEKVPEPEGGPPTPEAPPEEGEAPTEEPEGDAEPDEEAPEEPVEGEGERSGEGEAPESQEDPADEAADSPPGEEGESPEEEPKRPSPDE